PSWIPLAWSPTRAMLALAPGESVTPAPLAQRLPASVRKPPQVIEAMSEVTPAMYTCVVVSLPQDQVTPACPPTRKEFVMAKRPSVAADETMAELAAALFFW